MLLCVQLRQQKGRGRRQRGQPTEGDLRRLLEKADLQETAEELHITIAQTHLSATQAERAPFADLGLGGGRERDGEQFPALVFIPEGWAAGKRRGGRSVRPPGLHPAHAPRPSAESG